MLYTDIDPLFLLSLQQDTADDLLRRHQQLETVQKFVREKHSYFSSDATQLINRRMITIELQMAIRASEGRLVSQAQSKAHASWSARIPVDTNTRELVA